MRSRSIVIAQTAAIVRRSFAIGCCVAIRRTQRSSSSRCSASMVLSEATISSASTVLLARSASIDRRTESSTSVPMRSRSSLSCRRS